MSNQNIYGQGNAGEVRWMKGPDGVLRQYKFTPQVKEERWGMADGSAVIKRTDLTPNSGSSGCTYLNAIGVPANQAPMAQPVYVSGVLDMQVQQRLNEARFREQLQAQAHAEYDLQQRLRNGGIIFLSR